MIAVGTFEFFAAGAFLVLEEKHTRVKLVLVLILFILFDIMIMHTPMTEVGRRYHLELKHLYLDITVGCCLLMVGGYRRY